LNKRLGFLTGLGLISAILTLVIVGGLVLTRGEQLFSPGPLNNKVGPPLGGVTSHAEIAGKCGACHTAPWFSTGMSDYCMKCHVDVAIQQQDPASLHGALFKNNTGLACRLCHPEHNGPTSPITVLAKLNFPHDGFRFSLRAHKGNFLRIETACKDCHGSDFTRMDEVICGTCHLVKDPSFTQNHLTSFGPRCLACHDGVETYGKAFNHNDSAFPLNGKHSDLQCSQCHVDQRSISQLQATNQTCVDCHLKDDSHAGSLGTSCGVCHVTEGWKPAKFDHNQADFKLDGKHALVDCKNCHLNNIFPGTSKECSSCHNLADAHQGQLGSNCAACHSVDCWKPARFDHNLASFKLDGKHTQVSCQNCHSNGTYKGTPVNCSTCHALVDKHKGSFGKYCATCHTTSGWLPAAFDHTLSKFKLTGAHIKIQCVDCHANGIYKGTPASCYACHASIDKHNGTFGTSCSTCHSTSAWLPATFDHTLSSFQLTGKHLNVTCTSCHKNGEYKGTPTTCYACHVSRDKHQGSFGTNCSICHSTSGWLPALFDHGQSSFKLTGKHISVACASCHKNGVYKGTPTNCYACHASNDKHNGRYGTNCAVCHTTSGWLPASFDHNLSSFKLTGKHIGVTCTSCHKNGVYKGTPSNCYACHASNDKHNGSYGTNCAVCHTTSGWLPASFDHNLSSFKLTGKHIGVTCTSCHKNGVYKGTPTNCYACHASNDKHNGSYGTNCASCHTTSGWLPASFDHNLSSFKLTGKHIGVSCTSCHINGVYKGTPTTCYACHASNDKHNGSLGTNCASCHTTSGWLPATFDHNLSSFKLTGKHIGVSCTNCHINGVYKGTPTTCFACHASKDAHNGSLGTNCASCHTTSGWLPASFDHNLSIFKLTGAHLNVQCTNCHANGVYKGTPTACSACHAEPSFHAGFFGTACAQCHTTSNWNAGYPNHKTYDGINPVNHQGASCKDCHAVNVGSFSCLKCHDSNKPNN